MKIYPIDNYNYIFFFIYEKHVNRSKKRLKKESYYDA